jgi:hypothetical protein
VSELSQAMDFMAQFKAEGTTLEHHGVKGQKWGVRKAEDSGSGRSGQSDSDIAAKFKAVKDEPKTPHQKAKSIIDSQSKFNAQADLEAPPGKGWRPTKKQMAYIAAGAAVAGVLTYAVVKAKTGKELPVIPGEPVDTNTWIDLVTRSKQDAWSTGFLKDSSYDMPDFELPAGHTFQRMSQHAEDGYSRATYMTHNAKDHARYMHEFGMTGNRAKMNLITMESKEPIKVPSLSKRLKAMQEVMTEDLGYDTKLGYEAAPSDVKRVYQNMSGGDWNDNRAFRFFDNLGKKGYSAIVDDMDAGIIGDSPLVAFRPEAFKPKVSTPVSEQMFKAAASALREVDHRKFE